MVDREPLSSKSSAPTRIMSRMVTLPPAGAWGSNFGERRYGFGFSTAVSVDCARYSGIE